MRAGMAAELEGKSIPLPNSGHTQWAVDPRFHTKGGPRCSMMRDASRLHVIPSTVSSMSMMYWFFFINHDYQIAWAANRCRAQRASVPRPHARCWTPNVVESSRLCPGLTHQR